MKNVNRIKKILAFEVVVVLTVIAFTPGVVTIAVKGEQIKSDIKTIEFSQDFSYPDIEKDGEYIKINVNEANSYMTDQGGPKLPVFTKTFEFSRGTEITDISYQCSEIKTISISDKIEPVIIYNCLDGNQVSIEKKFNQAIYESSNLYPIDWLSYEKGTGIGKSEKSALLLSLHVSPVRYIPTEDIIEYISSIKIVISYKTQEIKSLDTNIYDLVIIAPSEFSNSLKPLIDHKNNCSVKTTLMTLEDIYGSFPGRDKPEQIKYFIKYAIEEWGIKYVLLVGDLTKLPIRTTHAMVLEENKNNLLSDLYYADIYDENGSFCSWDANGNNTFGEVIYNYSAWPPEIIDLDGVDLYPDVHLGRLPCKNSDEVTLMVNKIITYEEMTYDQTWFKKIILVGGDTFPPVKGNPFFIYEGEITNQKVAQQLPDFEHIKLWASKHNLNKRTFNRAINQGAGFLSYAGHGFEVGWGTYRPNSLSKAMITYNTINLLSLNNKNKLPIVFLDACLTSRLDFNMTNLGGYYKDYVRILKIVMGNDYNPDAYFPCFSWAFMNRKNGGAIATIGATRTAYTYVDKDGVYAGAGYLDVAFFKAYEEGITLGEMFTQAQNDYINYVGKDYFTIEEFLIFGDPTLMVGGYP